jgi:hypothetical protein
MSTSTPHRASVPLFHENVIPLRVPVPVALTQGTLALDLQPRLDPPAPAAGDLRRRRAVDDWTHRFVQAAVEIIGGDRPASQLVRHASRDVYADLERRALLVARAGGHAPGVARIQPVRPRVLSVHSCFVTGQTVEASAHVKYGDRSRAVAARFEHPADRWVCTALEFA